MNTDLLKAKERYIASIVNMINDGFVKADAGKKMIMNNLETSLEEKEDLIRLLDLKLEEQKQDE